ncbi:rRNA-processing protein utp21 [Coemansia sp. RSA 1086]|nr:rRNA-processing protein utp21 [Coemansia sp. RSA 1086]
MSVEEKRARIDTATEKKQSGSRLFAPYRALGCIASNTPHSMQYQGQSAFITTAVGKTFHVYDAEKIRLKFVGPQFESDVASVLSVGEETYVSAGGEIAVCRRGKQIATLEAVDRGEISGLIHFGDFLVGISADNAVVVWRRSSGEATEVIEFERESFAVTSVVHPSTYVNKIVVGSTQGKLQIWNVQTRRRLHESKSVGGAITCMAQAPAIDVVALGLADGRVVLHNVRADRTVLQVAQEGRVTGVSFRTDGEAIMATGSSSGDVALWDLDARRLVHVLPAHSEAVAAVDFMAGQALLVTSGADNAVREWVCDGADGAPRLLRQRSGHAAPPHMVRFHGADGRQLLSAGRDCTLRLFSIWRDEQSGELAQGGDTRLPPVTQLASSPAARSWDDVLTCHQGGDAHTWSLARRALGSFTLQADAAVRAVTVSACGSFGVLGLASGRIDIVNMQSGLARRQMVGHIKPVTAVQTDACNRRVFSAALDSTLRAWDFATGLQAACLELPASAARMAIYRDAGLLACACDDAYVRIVDVDTMRVVRSLGPHPARIADVAFSNDGRWLVTCALDCHIRTWDLPTGHLVDCLRVPSVPVSLAFSPTGDFLATAHMDSVGVFLWSNRTQFSDVTLRKIDPNADAVAVALPTAAGPSADQDDQDDSVPESNVAYMAPEKLTENMLTLSELPRSRWQTLLSLSAIKKRNQPEKPPQAPEQAPFFLPSTTEQHFVPTEQDQVDDAPDTKFLSVTSESQLARLLHQAYEDSSVFSKVFKHLRELGPSAVDVEIRTLPVDDELRALKAFILTLTAQLQSKRDFELVQSFLHVFLSVFSDVIRANATELEPLLVSLRRESQLQWASVDRLIRYSTCMVEFMRSSK